MPNERSALEPRDTSPKKKAEKNCWKAPTKFSPVRFTSVNRGSLWAPYWEAPEPSIMIAPTLRGLSG